MKHANGFVILALFISSCSLFREQPAPPPRDLPFAEPLFDGLGNYTRKVSTTSPEAQRFFDQGLNFLFAFNQDEAIRSFQQAIQLDPSCAMFWWGVAIANGPHYNNTAVAPDREKAAWKAVHEARTRAARGTPVEAALIEALSTRYADPPVDDRKTLDIAYANAMRGVWKKYPNDADAGALFAESLMDLRPWDLWTANGNPQPGTAEVMATLETVMAKSPYQPLALHLYIHTVEASPNPGLGDTAADRLRDLTPGLGHLTHMPSHIDIRRGRWDQSMTANTKAIAADDKYRSIVPRQGFYGLYIAHNHHMFAFSAMMVGRRADAVRGMDEIITTMPAGWAKQYSMIADGFQIMPLEARMRFGMWDEVLATPEYAEHFPIARTLRHYVRGVAYAAQGKTGQAREEQRALLAAKAKVPADATFGNNKAHELIAIAENVLEGETAYREGKTKSGIASLRKAVQEADKLRYDEPPDWIVPVRHSLGAALLQSRRYGEAEAVFREDLRRWPDNGWSLFGLSRSLQKQGKKAEAAQVDKRFQKIWAKSDTEISSPCFCQPGA